MAKTIVVLSFVLFSTPIFADTYFKLETGIVYYTPASDGVWRQERHYTNADWTSNYSGIGFGYRSKPWSYDLTFQYFSSGRVSGEWEWDDTYNVENANHDIQAFGVSYWTYSGLSLGVNRDFGNLYGRTTLTVLKYTWDFEGGRLHSQGSRVRDDIYHEDIISTIGLGGGYRINKNLSLEFMHYIDTSMSGGGVDAITSLGLVVEL